MSMIKDHHEDFIVDFHVHTFPQSIAARAIEALFTGHQIEAITDGTVPGTLEHMENAGVSQAVIQPVATKSAQVRSINDWAASQTDLRVISFGGIHPDYEHVQGAVS